MGFIKTDVPSLFSNHTIPGPSQPNPFSFLPFTPPSMDGLHPPDLSKPALGSDGRSKVARACTECKARKMRCDGGLPFCGRCITHNRTKSCAYVDPPKRSPITRQYVTSLESQLADANKKIVDLQAKAGNYPPTSNFDPTFNPSSPSSKPQSIKIKTEHAGPDMMPNPAFLRTRSLTGDNILSSLHAMASTSKKRSRTLTQVDRDTCVPFKLNSLSSISQVMATNPTASSSNHSCSPCPSENETQELLASRGSFLSLSSCTAFLNIATQLSSSFQSGGVRSQLKPLPNSLSRSLVAGQAISEDGCACPPTISCDTLDSILSPSAVSPLSNPSSTLSSSSLLPTDLPFSSWDENSKQRALKLVDTFFHLNHPFSPILHPPTFRAQLTGSSVHPTGACWPMLVNMVFALGSFESTTSSNHADADLHFYDQAKNSYSSALFETPNVTTVQALALMASYCQKRNDFSTSWMVLGSALRMAITLGLHTETPMFHDKPKQSWLQSQLDRRLWWSLFTMESESCFSLARPNTLVGLQVDTPFPKNIDDSSVSLDSLELPEEKNQATVISTLVDHARFASEISLPAQARLMRSPNPTIEEIRAFDLKAQEFLDGLSSYMDQDELPSKPVWFVLAASRLRWRCNNFRMLLFRPFVLSAALSASAARQKRIPPPALRPALKQAIALCRQLAKENIDSIARFWQDHSHHHHVIAWHAIQSITQSASLPLISLLDQPTSSEAPEWISSLQICRSLLKEMGMIHPHGAKLSQTIYRLASGLLDEVVPLQANLSIAGRNSWSHPSTTVDHAELSSLPWQHLYSSAPLADHGSRPSGLTLSLANPSTADSDGIPSLDFNDSPMTTRTSVADSFDATWPSARPTSASQWSDAGSHLWGSDHPATESQQPSHSDARLIPNARQRQHSVAANSSWTFEFDLGEPQSVDAESHSSTTDTILAHLESRASGGSLSSHHAAGGHPNSYDAESNRSTTTADAASSYQDPPWNSSPTAPPTSNADHPMQSWWNNLQPMDEEPPFHPSDHSHSHSHSHSNPHNHHHPHNQPHYQQHSHPNHPPPHHHNHHHHSSSSTSHHHHHDHPREDPYFAQQAFSF